GTALCVLIAWAHFGVRTSRWAAWYDRLIVSAMPFTVLTFVAVAAGGLIQIVPTVLVHRAANVADRIQTPYTPLELAGRASYITGGCSNCHARMTRALGPAVVRDGRAGGPNDSSRLGESIYDYPSQWGSRRIGPDLSRVGGKYADSWH